MAEMPLERGLFIHPNCIWRGVQIYGPELDQCCRARLKRTNKSYRVDETYIRTAEWTAPPLRGAFSWEDRGGLCEAGAGHGHQVLSAPQLEP
jgi:hypothetical protein